MNKSKSNQIRSAIDQSFQTNSLCMVLLYPVGKIGIRYDHLRAPIMLDTRPHCIAHNLMVKKNEPIWEAAEDTRDRRELRPAGPHDR